MGPDRIRRRIAIGLGLNVCCQGQIATHGNIFHRYGYFCSFGRLARRNYPYNPKCPQSAATQGLSAPSKGSVSFRFHIAVDLSARVASRRTSLAFHPGVTSGVRRRLRFTPNTLALGRRTCYICPFQSPCPVPICC